VLGDEARDLLPDFVANFLGDGLAVEERCGHGRGA
jgi:hypothetical protein